jgi:hypothetical protein
LAEGKTHRVVAKPQMAARFLADFMAASERSRRTIIQSCKFRRIARVIQHDQAKSIVGAYLRSGKDDVALLTAKAEALREQMADDDFGREVLDNNADYVDQFAKIAMGVALPKANLSAPGKTPALSVNGLSVTVDLCMRLARTTRTNKVRIGAATLRYAKSAPLSPEVGAWHSSFLLGYLGQDAQALNGDPENKLCLTVDAWTGICHPAPSDAVRRYKNMEAACATIAERWENVPAPTGAIF